MDQAKTQAQGRVHDWAESHGVETKYVDVSFHFIGASGIPKMDVVGTADPYIIAKLDDNIKYVCVRPVLLLVRNPLSMLQINRAGQHAQPRVERILEGEERTDVCESACRGHGQGRRYNNRRYCRCI